MKKIKFFVLIIIFTLCLGMGGNNYNIVSSIPEPDRYFKVTIVDQSNNSYKVQKISVDGLTFLPAKMGRADVGIDFKTIKKVNFYLQDDKVLAKIVFYDKSNKEFYIDPEVTFFGQTEWGKIRLKCSDIKEIVFK